MTSVNDRISSCRRQLNEGPTARRAAVLRRQLAAFEAEREDQALVAELATIDAAWDAVVAVAATALYGRPGDFRAETTHRNRQAGRRARRGLRPLETVSAELRRLAEARCLDTLDRWSGDARADALRSRLDRGEEIRAELTARADSRSGIYAQAA